jgi:hypothetical protein
MLRRLLVPFVFLGLPGICLAQAATEKYLSPTTQIYLRWDGYDAHRTGFEKTNSGQLLKGDMGTFLANLWTHLNENLDLLERVNPQIAALAKQLPGTLSALGKHGFALGIEVRKVSPPEVEMVCVFPGNGGPKGSMSKFVARILEVTGAPTKELRVNDIVMKHVSFAPLEWAFGSDGDTALMILGTVDPAQALRRGHTKGNNISKNAVYKEMRGFKEFEVCSQGFVDVGGFARLVSGISPEIKELVNDLGIKGLKSITFHSGFDGTAGRSVTDMNMPGERKGLLAMTKSRKFTLQELPALPHDSNSFSASSIDAPQMYDSVLHAIESGVKVFSPDVADVIKIGIQAAEAQIGISIRDDLLASLGDLTVSYTSPSESPLPLLNLGSVTLIQVKNEKKLRATLETLLKSLSNIPDLEVKKRNYRGVEVLELNTGGISGYTMTIHKGWLAVASYPQPVHGFILRSTGEFPTWKADAATAKVLATLPKEFVGFSYSDPRPGIELALSVVPPVVSALNGAAKIFLPEMRPFDVSTVPHPLEVNRFLFPTISVSIDDGKKLRVDTRSALALPF